MMIWATAAPLNAEHANFLETVGFWAPYDWTSQIWNCLVVVSENNTLQNRTWLVHIKITPGPLNARISKGASQTR